MGSPAAFLFDMDGLLLDSERVYCDIAADLMRPMGFAPDHARAQVLTLVGKSGVGSLNRLREILGDDADIEAFHSTWHGRVRQSLEDNVPVKATVRDSLTALAGAGGRMAVVTSTHRANALHHLEKAELAQFFELVVAGDEVPANKPDPAPYLQAAAALGLDPRHCVAFEDSDPGTTAAVRAGCRTTQIPDMRPPDHPLPDLGQHVAPDLWAALCALGVLGVR